MLTLADFKKQVAEAKTLHALNLLKHQVCNQLLNRDRVVMLAVINDRMLDMENMYGMPDIEPGRIA